MTSNVYRYTGQQFDAPTGLYSLRARYYNPALGRFLSRDTAGIRLANPADLNRYSYAANNSINASDPTGQQTLGEYAQENQQTAEEEPVVAEAGSVDGH
jgi:RHS repeat-associated protein